MKATLELTGTELVLLYLATGNESAGVLIRQCISEQREFDSGLKAVATTALRRGRRPKEAR